MQFFSANKTLLLLIGFVSVVCEFNPFADNDLFSINWAGPRETTLVSSVHHVHSPWHDFFTNAYNRESKSSSYFYSQDLPVLIAQMVERPLREREVVGSIPGRALS